MIRLPILGRSSENGQPSGTDHAAAAERFTQDEVRTDWHDASLWLVRQKRDRVAGSVPEWEALREAASRIKEHALSRLDELLVTFEERAQANGVRVHWARDAAEHNEIVASLLHARGVRRVVKSKSMLTEECHLNAHLEAEGFDVVDTDLGERIMQLSGKPPSHIVMPAIHVRKEEIGALFHQHLGTEAGLSDATLLTAAARRDLRARFLAADAAITGANFAVAETGGFVVCTNEGNADLGAHLAPLHIASIGIEKVIPRAEHLAVFLRLLARSATGQPITIYTSHFHRPRPGAELHVVLVDNGRSEHLGRAEFRSALKCIRCGACMNTCPVYRRSGGHSYGWTVPGPIGAVLAPARDLEAHASLPFASTLCGSCTDVCPVKIDLHAQLYRWRQLATGGGSAAADSRRPGGGARAKARIMRMAGWLFRHPRLYRLAGAAARRLARALPRGIVYHPSNRWGRRRELPEMPAESFRTWYLKHRSTHEQS